MVISKIPFAGNLNSYSAFRRLTAAEFTVTVDSPQTSVYELASGTRPQDTIKMLSVSVTDIVLATTDAYLPLSSPPGVSPGVPPGFPPPGAALAQPTKPQKANSIPTAIANR